MPGRLVSTVFASFIAAAMSTPANGAEYRGMTAGWPAYANGYYAANYPTSGGTGAAYYVARPVSNGAYGARPAGVMMMPVTAAYGNPSYFAAYGRSPVAYRPVTTAGYAPAAGGYYAPVTANYAPANSYAVAPAGSSSAGSEASTYYGQPAAVNYVPPRFAYRTNYAAVPVYMYRPVTTYDPITAQPVTCLQASTATTCQPQPQRTRCFSLLNPFTWFGQRSSCGSGGCGSPPPTTAYCGTAASQCGQPYYPVQPVVPVVPVPTTPLPANVIPAAPRAPVGATIPPPPTVSPGGRGVFTTPGLSPADMQPRIPSGTPIGPAPGGSFGPGTIITPIPSNPAPGGGITVPPNTSPPGGSFQTGPGAFGTGANYAPGADPYSSSTTLTPAEDAAPAARNQRGPSHSVFGSGFGNSGPRTDSSGRAGDNVIRAPELGPAMPPSVKTVPDLDAPPAPQPVNSAPQLLNPRDKTAQVDSRWAVVPAVWPQQYGQVQQLSDRPVVQTKSHQRADKASLSESPYAFPQQPTAVRYDDAGWKSAAH